MTWLPGPEFILIAETVVATKSDAKVFILSFCFKLVLILILNLLRIQALLNVIF